MRKYYSIALLAIMFIASISGCNATQPKYPGYIIGFTNPCESTVQFEVRFNQEHVYQYTVEPEDQSQVLSLFMQKKLLDKLGSSFEASIKNDKKSKTYTKQDVHQYFYMETLPDATMWEVDAGELCGKDLMKTKQEHLKSL